MNIWVGQVLAAGLVLTDELVKSKDREFGSLLGISEDELKFSNSWDKSQVTVLLAANATDIWEKWLRHIDSEFHIQNQKILLLVDNVPSHSSPKSSNNTNKTLSINNVEVDDYQLNSENEDLMDDFSGSRDNDKTKESPEKQKKEQCGSTRGRPCGSTHRRPRGRPRGSTSRRSRKSTSRRPCRSTCGRPHGNTHRRTRTNTNFSRRRNKEPSKTLKLTNIILHYLPPHTTVHIQPMDASIIKPFKSKYKRLYCEYTLKQFESNANTE
ncbi:46102_t:CDS:2, partial [Gigaspora margarita]